MDSNPTSKSIGTAQAVPTLLLLVALTALSSGAAFAHRLAKDTPPAPGEVAGESLRYLPSIESARTLALGHRSALADVFWVRTVLYFGEEFENRGTFTWLRHHLELVMGLDPDFYDVYLWAGSSLVIKEGVKFEDVMSANELVVRGVDRFVDDWRLPMTVGGNCAFWAKPKTEAQRAVADACKIKYFDIAASRPDVPDSVALLVAQYSERSGNRRLACESLVQSYMITASEDLKKEIKARLDDGICGEVTMDEVREARRRFEEAYGRYDYLDPDLAVHLYHPGNAK